MAALDELLAEIPKGAFRKETNRVVSLAKPSFAEKCYRPEEFPELHPEDIVHEVKCGDKLKNPRGGTIYCENNYRCLEYVVCGHKDCSPKSYHPPVQNPRHDQVHYLQKLHDHLGRDCLSFLPSDKRLAPPGRKTILRLGQQGPWCYLERTDAFVKALDDAAAARQQAADKRAADKEAAEKEAAEKAKTKQLETTDEPEFLGPSDDDDDNPDDDEVVLVSPSKPKAQRNLVLESGSGSGSEDKPVKKRTPSSVLQQAASVAVDSEPKRQKLAQGPITPPKPLKELSSADILKSSAAISPTAFAANLKQMHGASQDAYVKMGTAAINIALTADVHANALYIELVQLNRAGDSEEYSIKKREFLQTMPGMMYQALSAEEQYRAVVKEMRLKQIRA